MTTDTTHHTDVLIIGAGISGIGVACRLREEFPDRDIAILERRTSMGGTWDLFRYPGVRSDSDMVTFGYEFRPWDELQVLADGAAIKSYIESTAREYGVDRDIRYGLKVTAADWSSADGQWTVTATEESTGKTQTWVCDFLVTCTGYYNYDQGYLPDLPGAETFEGTMIHPQHWPEGFDYAGKNVVVIGSGATAITLVPAMAGTAGHVTMLQRSPSYVMSMAAVDKVTALQRRVLPRALSYRLTRARNIALWRAQYALARRFPDRVRAFLLRSARHRLGKDFDLAHFSPRYDPWDERLCAAPDGDIFRSLRDGSASVVTDRIDTFTETGIRLQSGAEIDADVVITATGLDLQVLGGATVSIDGVERRIEDGCTYKSVMLEDVPNLLWVFGYTNISWTLKVDLASTWLVRLLRHMEARGQTVATPVGAPGNAIDEGMVDSLTSGYIQRGKGRMPRQGREFPWRAVMDYAHDRTVLLDEPIDDGLLQFGAAPVTAPTTVASRVAEMPA